MADHVMEDNRRDSPNSERLIENMNSRKTQIRFNCFQDIMLLREVVAQNPFAGDTKKVWDSVATALSIYIPSISSRCCRERTQRLLKLYKAQELASLRRSGTEEQYEEKENLLQEIKRLEAEQYDTQVINRQIKRKYEEEGGTEEDIHSVSIAELVSPQLSNGYATPEDDSLDVDTLALHQRKRIPSSEMIVSYFTRKHESEMKLREAELKLKETEMHLKEKQMEIDDRKLALAERKLELEEERWKVEREERRENQKMIMELMLMLAKK